MKIYMLYEREYSNDIDSIDLTGIWDSPSRLIDYINSKRKQAFEYRIERVTEYSDPIGKIPVHVYEPDSYNDYILEFDINTAYGLDHNTLVSSVYKNEGENDDGAKYIRYKIGVFFQVFGAALWEPDPNVIAEYNRKVDQKKKETEFTGYKLQTKLDTFRSLYKDLVKHGIIQGGFLEVREGC